MDAPKLLSLVHKRFMPPAWIVLDEVANGTGNNAKRHADALAISLFPSRGLDLHGIEIKVSREDVKKELRTPRKAEAVGRYCDYWWLVISDESIIAGLEIPSAWGVLVPKDRTLHALRKAPKRKPTPLDREFFCALVRKVMSEYVTRAVHDTFRTNAREEVRKELERDREWRKEHMNSELENLKEKLGRYAKASGVDILGTSFWEVEPLGEAVKALMEARKSKERTLGVHSDDVEMLLEREATRIDELAASHVEHAEKLREGAKTLRARAKGRAANGG